MRGNFVAADLICRACPPSSERARECKVKATAQSLLNLKETLSGDNLTDKEVIDAYMEVFRTWLPFELRRRGLAQ